MSYCHDILLDKNFDRAAFAAAANDIRTLISRSEVKVVGSYGRPLSLPVVEENLIEFNGINQKCVCGESDLDDYCPPECSPFGSFGGHAQPFIIDLTSESYIGFCKDRYWFDCKTKRKPYDKLVKMSMIALKHHLGDSIELSSHGNWSYDWGAGYELSEQTPRRTPRGAVAVYEHIFPERAPVQNIFSRESDGF